MPEIKHESIGASSRKIEITEEGKELRKKELIEKYTATPWRFTIDQLSVWALWLTLAGSLFLYCTVKAVILAIH